MTANCDYLQVSQSFCHSFIPIKLLESLNTQQIQNPLLDVPVDGLDLGMKDSQILNWTPTTNGTVSLILYRAPTNGNLIMLQHVVPSIGNTGTYTWIPYQTTDYPDVVPNPADGVRSGRAFTISIVPDADPSKTNFWPAFAIDDQGVKLNSNGAVISTPPPVSTSTTTDNSTPAKTHASALPTISPQTSPDLIPPTILTDSTPLATSVLAAAPRLDTAPALPGSTTSLPVPPQQLQTSAPHTTPARDIAPGVIAGIALGALAIVLLSVFVAILACRRRRKRERQRERDRERYHEMPAAARVAKVRSSGGWHGEKEKEKEKERSRQELESGWAPPEIDSRRVVPGSGGGKDAYKSPRVSVPPKSRVVSQYI
ncbi:MAG: hypothetical protein Q9195_003852 [Heterodermia aff. obscurata]